MRDRIIEGLLVAGIIAAVTVYGKVQALDSKVVGLENTNSVLSEDMKTVLQDVAAIKQAVLK